MVWALDDVANVVLLAFFTAVTLVSAANTNIFVARFGRSHRLCGLALLLWLLLGLADMQLRLLPPHMFLAFDAMLGIMGTATTVSAAYHFGGYKGKDGAGNGGSGVLDADASAALPLLYQDARYGRLAGD